MKKILVLLIIVLMMGKSFGQSEKDANRTMADFFEKNYNEGNFDAIYQAFSTDMQAALTFEKTKDFLKGIKSQAGNITKRTFVKYDQSYASYKTNFDRAVFAVNISVNNNMKINGLLVKPFVENDLSKIARNTTKLQLPFKGEWTVVWGGDTRELNIHVDNEAQKNAFDIVIMDEKGNSYKTDGKTNEDYYAFGKELIAPCEGEIVMVIDGVKDNIPGVLNPYSALGNAVVIKTPNNEYLILAHLVQNSTKVKQGQKVVKGHLLGLCGNSGNSSEPHLHFHIQNVEEMNSATGVKCYFDELMVNSELKKDYSPIQNNKICNVKK